ncbi:hypothetical protein HDU67_007458 [Dinochytrium kinnereticum]|nr:hypothetical protein HDU67_007458 [Dinochytrium kinnereticum]
MSVPSPKRHSSMVNIRKVAQDQQPSSPHPSSSSPIVAASEAAIPKRKRPVDLTNGLVPPSATDAYLDRLKGWSDVVRRLISHFECIVEQERKLADVYFKSAKDLSSPIRVGGAEVFGVEESIQAVMKNLFDAQSKLSSEHLAAASHIESETLPELKSLLAEVRKKSIDADKEWVALDKGLARDREVYGKLAANLKASIRRQVKVRGGAANPDLGVDKDVPRDPWIANIHIQRHINGLLKNQSDTREALASQEQNFAVFEQVTLQHLRLALTNHFVVSNKTHSAHISASTSITSSLESMNPSSDWEVFRRRRSDVILDRLQPLVRQQDVKYDGMNDPGCEAVKEGALMKRIPGVLRAKGFKPGYYALTVSGFLHGFPGPDAVESGEPTEASVWLPDCTVGAKGALDAKEPYEFMIQEKSTGFLKGGEKIRLKAEGGDESDFWYELISATAAPIVARPELLETLEEDPSPRPSNSDYPPQPVTSPRTEDQLTPISEKPLSPAIVAAPVSVSSPISVTHDLPSPMSPNYHEEEEAEEEQYNDEDLPADLAAMRSHMFSTVSGDKGAMSAAGLPSWGSTASQDTLGGNGWDDAASPWS